jgi:hypothetical protein
MEIVQLILLALETVSKIAVNPNLGLGDDAARVSALVGVVANLGRQGAAAIPELKAFTAEIQELANSGKGADPGRWDALTARRHAQAAAIAAAAAGGQ